MARTLADYDMAVAKLDAAMAPDVQLVIDAPPISQAELEAARPSPDCIVERMFYADILILIGAGGVSKTTIMLHMLICVVLGRPVFGEPVRKSGPIVLLTAEDTREILVARLRACMDAMGLTDGERLAVMDGVRIADVSGQSFKLTAVYDDVVMPSVRLQEVIDLAIRIKPVMVLIDPAVSFGVGESRVNDAEQGLVEAGRAIRNAVNCAVCFIHHTGKSNARNKIVDQYSGRGGSAFADGARMVLVLQIVSAADWQDATGETLADGETGLVLARPKMSYCRPPGDIYVKRMGYHFERVEPLATSKARQAEDRSNQVWNLLAEELRQGRYHSKNSLQAADAGGLTRQQIRDAVALLEARGRVELRDRPNAGNHGARKYFHPVTSPEGVGEPTPKTVENCTLIAPSEISILASPSLRENKNGEPTPSFNSHAFLASPFNPGEPTANPANRSDVEGSVNVELD